MIKLVMSVALIAFGPQAFADVNCQLKIDQDGHTFQLKVEVKGKSLHVVALSDGNPVPDFTMGGPVDEVTDQSSEEDQDIRNRILELSGLGDIRNKFFVASDDARGKIGGLLVNLDDMKKSFIAISYFQYSNLECVISK